MVRKLVHFVDSVVHCFQLHRITRQPARLLRMLKVFLASLILELPDGVVGDRPTVMQPLCIDLLGVVQLLLHILGESVVLVLVTVETFLSFMCGV